VQASCNGGAANADDGFVNDRIDPQAAVGSDYGRLERRERLDSLLGFSV
jgi:hypothetical protein